MYATVSNQYAANNQPDHQTVQCPAFHICHVLISVLIIIPVGMCLDHHSPLSHQLACALIIILLSHQLALALIAAAEARLFVPCLSWRQFSSLFSLMGAARSAACSARRLLSDAHEASRAGDLATAAELLAEASESAVTGKSSDPTAKIGDGAEPSTTALGRIRHAASAVASAAHEEDPTCVLAPRCCIQV